MRLFLSVCLLALVLFPCQAPASSQSSSSSSTSKPKDRGRPKQRYFNIGLYAGQVLAVDEAAKTFDFRVHGTTAVPHYTPGNPTS
jgi:hypothetical protein